MKKNYEAPNAEVVEFLAEDVITSSTGNDNFPGMGDGGAGGGGATPY